MPRNANCVVCGSTIRPRDAQPEWLGDYFVLYTINDDVETPRTSGRAAIVNNEDVIPIDTHLQQYGDALMVDVDGQAVEVGEGWVPVHLVTSLPARGNLPLLTWGFPIHHACWEVMYNFTRCDPRFDTAEGISGEKLYTLLDLCRTHYVNHGLMHWDHTYGGLFEVQGDHRLVRVSETRNPTDIPHMNYDPSTHYDLGEHRSLIHPGNSPTNDPLQSLSPELRDMIVELLPTESAVNLRLASRAFASMTLSPSFWRSRFMPGFEFECLRIFADRFRGFNRWRVAYMAAKNFSTTLNVVNRRRIWGLVSKLVDMIEVGIKVRPQSYQELNLEGKTIVASRREETEWAPLWESQWAGASLFPGSRLHRLPAFEANYTFTSKVKSVAVCFVQLEGNKKYVSGLIFTFQDEGKEPVHLGYTKTKKMGELPRETPCWDYGLATIDELPGDIVGFNVAMDDSGIRGLRLSGISGIKLAVDVFKMVRLSILCPPSSEINTNHPTSSQPLSVSDFWPVISTDDPISVGDHRLRNITDQWLPVSTCLFGGADGKLLRHLDKVTIWRAKETASGDSTRLTCIHAFEFHFKQPIEGRYSMTLGRIPCSSTTGIESHTIPLDSAHGERITGIDVIYNPLREIHAIRVHTSEMRKVLVPANAHESDEWNSTVVKQFRDDESDIVGIYTSLEHGMIPLSLGVIYSHGT